jgi:hypothetical protein
VGKQDVSAVRTEPGIPAAAIDAGTASDDHLARFIIVWKKLDLAAV